MHDLPLRVRLTILSVLTLISALLWSVPTWAVAGWDAWPVAAGLTVVMVAGLALGNGRSDAAAQVGHTLLGVAWIAFAWSLLTLPLRLVLEPGVVGGIVVAVTAALAAWGAVEAFRLPRVRRVEVSLPRLPEALDGLRVAVLADTHFDAFGRESWARRLVDLVNSLEPDVVAHCGDLADGSVAARRGEVDALSEVKAEVRAYIAGNHEYYSDATSWLGHMEVLGWDVLRNRHLLLHRGDDALVIAGLDDPTGLSAGAGPDLDAALAGAPAGACVLLLAHQPHQVRDVVDRVDLQLSGHTHGGQIWPFHYLVRLREPVVQGLSSHGARTRLWVSRGAGFWGPPFRVFAPSEVSLLTLRAGS